MTVQQQTTWKEKIALISASLILGFVLIEGGLQLLAYSTQWKRLKDKPILQENEYRILALGESTTDKFYSTGGDFSWPGQLDRMLSEKFPGVKFRVINKGLAATSSSLILKNLPEYMETWRPHLVIAMMGVNDQAHLEYLQKDGFFSKLIIVKIVRSALQGLKHIPLKKVPPTEISGKLREIIREEINVDLKEIPVGTLQWINENPSYKWFAYQEISQAFFNQFLRMLSQEKEKIDRRLFCDVAKKSVEMNPQNNKTVSTMLFICSKFQDDCRHALRGAFEAGLQPDDPVVNQISWTDYTQDKELQEIMEEFGFFKGKNTPLENLKQNYRKLASQVLPFAKLAVMSYPTTDIKIFKSFFANYEHYYAQNLIHNLYHRFEEPRILPAYKEVLFIDNSDFPQTDRQKYFLDDFAWTPRGSFGHTTALGHQVIAKKVISTLEDELREFTKKLAESEKKL
jgi:lysophospholipase L1-like esterase